MSIKATLLLTGAWTTLWWGDGLVWVALWPAELQKRYWQSYKSCLFRKQPLFPAQDMGKGDLVSVSGVPIRVAVWHRAATPRITAPPTAPEVTPRRIAVDHR